MLTTLKQDIFCPVRRDAAFETLKKFKQAQAPVECGWSEDQRRPENGIPALGFFVVRATGDNGSVIKANRFLQLRVGGRDERFGEDSKLPGLGLSSVAVWVGVLFLNFWGWGFRFQLSGFGYNMKYLEYLRSEDWQILRKAKLSEQGRKCQACGAKTAHPHVHHVIYRCPIESGQVDDLRVMCEKCHKTLHKNIRSGRIRLFGDCLTRWAISLKGLAGGKHKGRRKGKLGKRKRRGKLSISRGGESLNGFRKPVIKWSTLTEAERLERHYDRVLAPI